MLGDAHSPDWCQMGRQLPSIQNYEEKISREWQLFVNSEEQRSARNGNASSFNAIVDRCVKNVTTLLTFCLPSITILAYCTPATAPNLRASSQQKSLQRICQPAPALSFSPSHPQVNICQPHLDIRTGWSWVLAGLQVGTAGYLKPPPCGSWPSPRPHWAPPGPTLHHPDVATH